MAKKMLIDATHAEETRVVVVDGNKVEEFDFETLNRRQLAGNIYLAKVTRVEPSLQAAFVDYGGNRHGFLAFAEIHPDYYQIPTADRQALIAEERAMARAEEEEENRRSRRRKPAPRAEAAGADPVVSGEAVAAQAPNGMQLIDFGDDAPETSGYAPSHSDAPRADLADAEDRGDYAADDAASADSAQDEDHADHHHDHRDHDPRDHAQADDDIESVGEDDVSEEISAPKRQRARKYKIQEVIKVRQIMLVQVVKEERGNKGAALTTYLSLAGRYCVLMPNTARGGGISRKITNAPDRKKLKEIASELSVPEGAGLIIRTAGAKRTKPEIRRDYEYLMRLWEQVRDLTLRSVAPAAIYEEGDLIKRSIRDLYSREIDEVLVEGEGGYRTARDFMRMIMPSHAKQVKRYDEPIPLFARFQVESYLGGMFNPVVQLKSGGYIVIGITEALVAIDVNSGRATKEGSIEDTATKTNLEACDEVARQLRLRDLAGLIVIDFIDMEERKNNAAVEKRLKDKLKTDRARIQVGRISGFGLMEMSRQRLRPGMLESTTQPCAHCHGTGLIRSDDSMALNILRALEEEGTRKRSKEVLLRAPVSIVNYLFNHKREHIALIEARYGMAVRMEADPSLVSPDYVLDKFKTATRAVPEQSQVISGHAGLMGDLELDAADETVFDEIEELDDIEETEDDEIIVAAATAAAPATVEAREEGNGDAKKKRRRRRRRGGRRPEDQAGVSAEAGEAAEGDDASEDDADAPEAIAEGASLAVEVTEVVAVPEAVVKAVAPKSSSSRSRSKPVAAAKVASIAPVVEAVVAAPVAEVIAEEAPAPKRTRTRKKPVVAEAVVAEVAQAAEAPAKPKATRSRAKKPTATLAAAEVTAVAAAPVAENVRIEAPVAVVATPEVAAVVAAAQIAPASVVEVAADAAAEDPSKPRRKGWWSLGR